MTLPPTTYGMLDKPLTFLRTHVLHSHRISVDENIPCTYTFLGLLVPFTNKKYNWNLLYMVVRSV